jgi:hypothetical protein
MRPLEDDGQQGDLSCPGLVGGPARPIRLINLLDERFVKSEPMGPGGSAALAAAWQHRHVVLG